MSLLSYKILFILVGHSEKNIVWLAEMYSKSEIPKDILGPFY